MKETAYLAVMGLFGLAYAAVLLSANIKITLTEHENSFDTLRWMGMKELQISHMFLF